MSLNILPNELIESIAINLNYIDLCNLLQVNNRFNSYLTNFHDLWQLSFRKQWPILYDEVFEPMKNKSEINWRSETMQCHLIGVKVYRELCQMSARYFQNDKLSDNCFESFRGMAAENRRYCVINELEFIINSDNETHDLTIKFYAQKVLRSLRTELVRQKWAKMVQELNYNQIERVERPINVLQLDKNDVPGDLITGSVLIAQYCQPNITVSETNVRQKIRAIALETVKTLEEKYPKNDLINHRHGELLSQFEASRLTESILEPKDCLEVIHAINITMYEGSSRFCGNRDNYYLPTNSYIDKVLELKLGIPILLCIIYQATAALLGVKLFPISNPGHFMLAIRDKPNNPEMIRQFTYIDPFNGGKLSDQPVNVMPHVLTTSEHVLLHRPLSIFMRLVNNLVNIGQRQMWESKSENILRNGLELADLICEENTQMQMDLARSYVSPERMLQISNRLVQPLRMRNVLFKRFDMEKGAVKPLIVAKYRTNVPEMQFAVGMIMRDNELNLICVIYDWIISGSSEWKAQIAETHVPNEGNQPLYKILLEDGSTRYTAQKHLSIEWRTDSKIKEIFDPKIGRYFTRFNGRNYELNEEMRVAFPDDERAINEIYLKHSKE